MRHRVPPASLKVPRSCVQELGQEKIAGKFCGWEIYFPGNNGTWHGHTPHTGRPPNICSVGAAQSCVPGTQKELRKKKKKKKISPYIISRYGCICQVISKKFFKKIFAKKVAFRIFLWYNVYRKDERRRHLSPN